MRNSRLTKLTSIQSAGKKGPVIGLDMESELNKRTNGAVSLFVTRYQDS